MTPQTLQPVGHLLKVFGGRTEPADRLMVRIVMHGNKDLPGVDIDPRRARCTRFLAPEEAEHFSCTEMPASLRPCSGSSRVQCSASPKSPLNTKTPGVSCNGCALRQAIGILRDDEFFVGRDHPSCHRGGVGRNLSFFTAGLHITSVINHQPAPA